jgi:ubiquinone biosynthesis protein UbiJ
VYKRFKRWFINRFIGKVFDRLRTKEVRERLTGKFISLNPELNEKLLVLFTSEEIDLVYSIKVRMYNHVIDKIEEYVDGKLK